jgi:hypothetical protein
MNTSELPSELDERMRLRREQRALRHAAAQDRA